MKNTIRTKLIQVKIENEWQYVFCHNFDNDEIITTRQHELALRQPDIEHFRNHFSENEFRIISHKAFLAEQATLYFNQ